MPFDCAKAVMATFCFEIRHLLTPLFGKSFMDICLQDTDPGFGLFKIDPDIVRACTEDMHSWRILYAHDGGRSIPSSPASPSTTYTTTSAPTTPLLHKSLRPRATKRKHNPFSGETESGYGTDPERDFASSSAYTSPNVSPKTIFTGSEWTSINRTLRADSPATGLLMTSTPPIPRLKKLPRARRAPDLDECWEGTDASDDDHLRHLPSARATKQAEKRERTIKLRAKDLQAAKTLMEMSALDRGLSPTPGPALLGEESPTKKPARRVSV